MRSQYLLICLLLSTACASRSISSRVARDRIMEIPIAKLEKEDVDVLKVTRVGGSEAIAETSLKTAFRIEKVKNRWIVREVRIGHGQWEKITDLAAALETVKTAETNQMLDQIAAALLKYRDSTGRFPDFKNYVALSDQLSPRYLTPLIRLDAWKQPLEAERPDADTVILRSAGPDLRFGTADDIRKTVSR